MSCVLRHLLPRQFVRNYGALFQVHTKQVKTFHHYIGTDDDKDVHVPLGCTFTLVPRSQFAKTVKKFLIKWDTKGLSSFQIYREMDLWETFFCNYGHPKRGAKEIALTRIGVDQVYSIKILGKNQNQILFDWRKELELPGAVPLLLTEETKALRLSFNWCRFASIFRIKQLEGERTQIIIANQALSYFKITGDLAHCYESLERIDHLNPFFAFGFSNATSVRQIDLTLFNDHIITLTEPAPPA